MAYEPIVNDILRIFLPYEVLKITLKCKEGEDIERFLRYYVEAALGDYGFSIIPLAIKPEKTYGPIRDRFSEIICYGQDTSRDKILQEFLIKSIKHNKMIRVGLECVFKTIKSPTQLYCDYLIILRME